MNITKKDMKNIQNLVGDITEDNLKYVDAYVCDKLGIFIPSIGFCEYAIKPNHTHPSYSFIIFFSENQNMIDVKIKVPSNYYLISAMSPETYHEEEKSDTFNRYIAIFIDKDFFDNQYAIYDSNKPQNYFWDQFIIKKDVMVFIKKFMSEYEENFLGKDNLLNNLSMIITHELIRSILNLETIKDIVIKKDEIYERPSRQFLHAWRESGAFKDYYKDLAVFSLKHGTATTWTMADNFAEKSYINL